MTFEAFENAFSFFILLLFLQAAEKVAYTMIVTCGQIHPIQVIQKESKRENTA